MKVALCKILGSPAGILLGAAVLALALVGSASGRTFAKSASTTVVLSGWSSSPEETASLRNVVAAFEATHPAITVDYEPLDNYQSDMESRFAAGNPPDVFYVDSNVAPDWIAKGFLLPLQGLVTSRGFDTSHFFPVLRRAFEGPGGQPYGFPKDWSPLAMYTNNALLGQAGIAPPATWAQLREAAERLRAVTGLTPICLSADWARLLAFVEENGGSFLNDARTAVTINSTAASEAVDFYVGLVRDGLAALLDQLGSSWCGQAFADGKVAIAFEGTWLLPVLDSAAPRPDYSVHPLLSNARRGNIAFTVAYSIAAASQHKQAAWELLSYLTGREGMLIWTSGGVALPSRDDVAPAPGREVFIGEAAVSTVWQFAPGFAGVLSFANDELSSVFGGSETIGGMLAAIETAANAALTAPG
jgi:multiple sugar transport system substrate-binding protein